ncbi:MAG: nitrilase-related carbon-nitrogen hydrolase, partial [Clostridia bacterium]|nr:nitrilase-related carbon-nitrogen hydrolase [Clostridia bacterium]
FAAEQNAKWLEVAEPVPGPTTELMQEAAARHGVVLVVPLAEIASPGEYYNTAVVIDADGSLLGKYRKVHLPHIKGFQETFYFKTGDLGYPVFKTRYGTIGVLIDFDRHYPEVARILALKGAQILFNPCTTVMDLSSHLWFVAQRSHAALNGVFLGTSNRVGTEPFTDGVYYGMSYFCGPNGEIMVQGAQNRDEIIIADMDLGQITEEMKRWKFFDERHPETYHELLLPTPTRGNES